MKEKIKKIIKSEIFYTIVLIGFIAFLQLWHNSLVREIEEKEFTVLVNVTQMSSANTSYAGFYSEINFMSQAVQKCKGDTGQACEIILGTYNRKIAEFRGIEDSIWASYGALEDAFKEYNQVSNKNKLKISLIGGAIQLFILIIIAYGFYTILKKRKAQ